jgi:hypothetical protein
MNGEVVPQDKLDYILEAARLAPSSSVYNHIKCCDFKQKSLSKSDQWLKSKRYYRMFSLVGFCMGWLFFGKIETVFNEMMEVRGLPLNTMDAYKSTLWECTNHLVKNGMPLTPPNKRILHLVWQLLPLRLV